MGEVAEDTANETASAARDPKQRKERVWGLVPIMKSLSSLKGQVADLGGRMEQVEKQLGTTSGKIEGVLKSTIVECPICESYVQIKKFPRHFIKMHPPEFEIEGEVDEPPLLGEPFGAPDISEPSVIGEALTDESWEKLITETFPKRPSEEVIGALDALTGTLRKRGWL